MADTDRELLELAAKAAGIELCWFEVPDGDPDCSPGWYCTNVTSGGIWCPLTDDGDALRLAVKLRMTVEAWGCGAAAVVSINNRALVSEPHYGDDPERATRRAIVRAAAAIGQAMDGSDGRELMEGSDG